MSSSEQDVAAGTRRFRDLHFDLSFLGAAHAEEPFILRAGGGRYPLRRHDAATLAALGRSGGKSPTPTHYAAAVASPASTVQLLRVLGPPGDDGLAPLRAIVIATSSGKTTFGSDDIAQALIFLNPGASVLTAASADIVLGHVAASPALPGLRFAIESSKADWCRTEAILDGGQPMIGPTGRPLVNYVLNPLVLNSTAPVSGQARAGIYSDASLLGTRWNLAPGVASLDAGTAPTALPPRGARAATTASGYTIALQDAGPNFGISVAINGLSDDLVLDLTVTNSYIRHTSVFASFLKADGVTPIVVPDNIWTALLKGAVALIVTEWLDLANAPGAQELLALLGSEDNTLKWLGNVSAESTFFGVPVSSTNVDFTFALPSAGSGSDDIVSRIRILVGSLGTNSGLDWDPTAAWLGLSMTALLDLALPTYSLITTVGEESGALFDKIFKSAGFLLPTAYSVFLVAKDIFTGSANTGNDLSGALISLADALVQNVLTSADVIAALAAYFGAEEAEEAIPFVGWAVKVMALEAAVVQLAQTIGEVIASPRVVEFDITISMNAQITLVPDAATGDEFPATATAYSITAQYSDSTTRTCSGSIPDAKIGSIVIPWDQVPIGGQVSFVVALFDANGWGVGKGVSSTVANQINGTDVNGNPALVIEVAVQQQLYPLSAQTTYLHSQLLAYDEASAGYSWLATMQAPTETAQALGTGPSGHVLQALSGLTLSDDQGVLGYVWQASGLGIPAVNGGTTATELFAMQNIGFKPPAAAAPPTWPDAGYMASPAGYDTTPQLLYLRTAEGQGPAAAGPACFFLDPTGPASTGFQLRAVTLVTDPAVPLGDPSRLFDLGSGQSWGRFAFQPNSMAIHSNGYVLATAPGVDNLQILRLPGQAAPDAAAPWATMPLGPGTAPGRVLGPALVAIRPDQTILVLEAVNQRIQAFSLGGHPVQAFPGLPTPYWIPLVPHAPPGTSTVFLAMSTDVAGYVYVLSQIGNGYVAADFFLDIYTPGGTPLLTQQGLVAAGMAVDLWRNVYALNFQQIAGPGGQTQPSLSEYIPSTPKPA